MQVALFLFREAELMTRVRYDPFGLARGALMSCSAQVFEHFCDVKPTEVRGHTRPLASG